MRGRRRYALKSYGRRFADTRRSTSRCSIICWRLECEGRERFGEEFRLNKAELDRIFESSCYGLHAPLAVCATYNHTPFVYQNAAKHLWPMDEGSADHAKGCYYVINVGELEDAMRYSLKTINPDGCVDNFFCIYAPWTVLGAKRFRGQLIVLILMLFLVIFLIAYGAYVKQTGASVRRSDGCVVRFATSRS